jgi:nucleoid-associated protein YgaU
MGLLDNVFGKDDDKKKADFSNVQSGSSSTAPAPAAAPASVPAAAPAARTYTVKAGDSLSKIAKHEYGDAAQWKKIYEANKDQIKNPDLIHPGQTFRIP